MKNDKSPGLDGFTVEFFKLFWLDLGNFILRSLNFGYNNGNLSVTQKQGIITCLPKQDKNRFFLKLAAYLSFKCNLQTRLIGHSK